MLKENWINVPRKTLSVVVSEYGHFAPDAFFLRQKVLGRAKMVNVSRGNLSELLKRMPGRVNGDVSNAKLALEACLAR